MASLKRYGAEVSWDEFVRKEDRQNMVLFALFRAAQTAVDLGQRVLAARRLGGAEIYAEVFERLGQHGILSTELAERCADGPDCGTGLHICKELLTSN